MSELAVEEIEFVEQTKPKVKEFLETRTERDIDIGVGAFIKSEKGDVYHGVPFPGARMIHAEENAIGSMVTAEGVDARIRMITIVGGGENICMPCGMCRVAIYRYSTENTAILPANLTLSEVEKFTITELYPYPYRSED